MKKVIPSTLCVSLAFLFASFAQAGETITETKNNSAVATAVPRRSVIDKNT